MAKLELSRELSLNPEDAWDHASNLSELGDWLQMHEGWRGEVPAELTVGATLVGVAGAKGLRNRVTWTVRELDPPLCGNHHRLPHQCCLQTMNHQLLSNTAGSAYCRS